MEKIGNMEQDYDFFMLPRQIRKLVISQFSADEKKLFRDYFYSGNWKVENNEQFKSLLVKARTEGNEVMACNNISDPYEDERIQWKEQKRIPCEAVVAENTQDIVKDLDSKTEETAKNNFQESPQEKRHKPKKQKKVSNEADVLEKMHNITEKIDTKPVVEKEPQKPSQGERQKKEQKETRHNTVQVLNENGFSHFLIDAAAGNIAQYEDYPQKIIPRKIWQEKITQAGYAAGSLGKTKKYVVMTPDGQIRFSTNLPDNNRESVGFKGKSLIDDDPEKRYALRVLAEISEQERRISDWMLYRESYIGLDHIYKFLTDKENLLFSIAKMDKEAFWVFSSKETDAKKHGDFKDGYNLFRDRWLNIAGVERRNFWDNIFSTNGIPWSNGNTRIWKDVCRAVANYYKLVIYRNNENGVLTRE